MRKSLFVKVCPDINYVRSTTVLCLKGNCERANELLTMFSREWH